MRLYRCVLEKACFYHHNCRNSRRLESFISFNIPIPLIHTIISTTLHEHFEIKFLFNRISTIKFINL